MRYTLAFLLLFAGCVRIPTDEANCKMQAIPSLELTIEEALANPHFKAGPFPSPNWWEMFYDPQLNSLISQALSNSPTMSRVAARVEAAEAEARIKRSRLLPSIGFYASADWEYLSKNSLLRAFTPVIPGYVPEYELGLDFTYELDFWGKNRNVYQAALGEAKAAMAEQQTAILMLTTSIASVYFKLQAELEQLELLKDERKILTRMFELTKKRLEHALDNTQAKLVAQDNLLTINQNIKLSQERVKLSRHLLNMLVGQGPDSCQEVERIVLRNNGAFPLPQNISSELLARRSDLMALVWRVEAAAHLVGAAKADFYPRVDLFALAGLDSVFFRKLFTSGSLTGLAEPALYLPIFTGGRLRANLREKHAEFEEAIYTYNEAVFRAVKEVADQIVILKTASENLKIEEMVVETKIQDRNLSRDLYKNALGSLLNFLDAQNQVIQQQFEKIELQYKQKNAAIQLIKAIGGGYCTEEVPLG